MKLLIIKSLLVFFDKKILKSHDKFIIAFIVSCKYFYMPTNLNGSVSLNSFTTLLA